MVALVTVLAIAGTVGWVAGAMRSAVGGYTVVNHTGTGLGVALPVYRAVYSPALVRAAWHRIKAEQ